MRNFRTKPTNHSLLKNSAYPPSWIKDWKHLKNNNTLMPHILLQTNNTQSVIWRKIKKDAHVFFNFHWPFPNPFHTLWSFQPLKTFLFSSYWCLLFLSSKSNNFQIMFSFAKSCLVIIPHHMSHHSILKKSLYSHRFSFKLQNGKSISPSQLFPNAFHSNSWSQKSYNLHHVP